MTNQEEIIIFAEAMNVTIWQLDKRLNMSRSIEDDIFHVSPKILKEVKV